MGEPHPRLSQFLQDLRQFVETTAAPAPDPTLRPYVHELQQILLKLMRSESEEA
ncbi:hypothetical protein J31TS4_31680 [Paenibacillus sp. J31TS4]|uniref:hypothetical protein n=1 Tax=Paenibacillus sp. J31TS4 TaxID=2807195 RepID=UPI001B0FB0EC|nr:hypothetical protein [Paenibacillus sp. J31TS4]GIP39888.1 hypothetical protein J31TS4_31680 [Paenibacillus sp. J31TS4]